MPYENILQVKEKQSGVEPLPPPLPLPGPPVISFLPCPPTPMHDPCPPAPPPPCTAVILGVGGGGGCLSARAPLDLGML